MQAWLIADENVLGSILGTHAAGGNGNLVATNGV